VEKFNKSKVFFAIALQKLATDFLCRYEQIRSRLTSNFAWKLQAVARKDTVFWPQPV